MIDVATWRARIGLYNASTGGPSGRRSKVLRAPTGDSEWSLLLALGTTAMELVALHFVIASLLLLAGDVELNPGPGTGEDSIDEGRTTDELYCTWE